MIKRAFEKVDTEEGIREEQYDPEIFVYDTGDYAVTWAVFYYIKDVKRLLPIKHTIRSYILKESILSDISLSTPVLQNNSVELIQNTTVTTPIKEQHRKAQVKDALKSQQQVPK